MFIGIKKNVIQRLFLHSLKSRTVKVKLVKCIWEISNNKSIMCKYNIFVMKITMFSTSPKIIILLKISILLKSMQSNQQVY